MITRFENKTVHKKIALAVTLATTLLTPFSPMVKDIAAKTDFQYDSGPGDFVSTTLLAERKPIQVFTYRKAFTKAVGYFDGQAIYINLAKVDSMTELDLAGLLLHEYSHYCGFHHTDPGFWGRRRANYKTINKCLYSVPYWISENIGMWA